MACELTSPPRALHLPPPGRPRWVCPDTAALDLLYLGWGRRRFGPNPIPPSRHPGWVCFFIGAGRPVLQLEGAPLATHAGQVLVVGPDCVSGWTDTPLGVSEVLTWVWRSPPRCPECAPPAGAWRAFDTSPALRRLLREAHAQCRAEVGGPDSLTGQALEQTRLRIDVALARSTRGRPAVPAPALRLELALGWMAQNLAEPSPVAALSEYLQVSPVTLQRLFQTQLGESAGARHSRLRMDRARELLAQEGATVKEAAYTLGYRHPNDLSRAFKRQFGRPPSAFARGLNTPRPAGHRPDPAAQAP